MRDETVSHELAEGGKPDEPIAADRMIRRLPAAGRSRRPPRLYDPPPTDAERRWRERQGR